MRKLTFVFILLVSNVCFAQTIGKLTIEKIMKDPKWIGTSPRNTSWSTDSRYLFFQWNPDKAQSDSIYYISPTDLVPKKTTYAVRQNMATEDSVVYNTGRTAYAYTKDGDIFYSDVKSNTPRRITETIDLESNPQFIINNSKLVYTRNQNLFAFDLATGLTSQLTNFQRNMAISPNANTIANQFQQRTAGQGQREQEKGQQDSATTQENGWK
jgi:hypothetical protein